MTEQQDDSYPVSWKPAWLKKQEREQREREREQREQPEAAQRRGV